MSKISEQKALEAYQYGCHTFVESKREGYIKGYDQAMPDFLEKAIIAYCEVCKMPNCVMQNQKEICPYLSKFRKCLKSLLNN